MINFKDKRGSVTVFLSIVLVGLIALIGTFIDVARIKGANSILNTALESSCTSVLAGYDKVLKDRYGLFALCENNTNSLKEEIYKYLDKNLDWDIGISPNTIDKKTYKEIKSLISDVNNEKFHRLYNFKFGDLSLLPDKSLSEADVLANQMMEFVKYRLPNGYMNGFVERMQGFRGSSKKLEAINKKIEIDDELRNQNNGMKTKKYGIDIKKEVLKLFLEEKNKEPNLKIKVLKEYYEKQKDLPSRQIYEKTLWPSICDLQDINEKKENTKVFREEGQNILKTIEQTLNEIKNATGHKRNDLLIDEYVIGMFKNYTSDINNVKGSGIKDEVKRDLRGREKFISNDSKARDTFFEKCEVEYILTGKPDEKASLNSIKDKILLIRFLMNTLQIYLDRGPEGKYMHSLALAKASGITTEFDIPVLHSSIMLRWALAESVQDVEILLRGNKVPIIKTNKQWVLSNIEGMDSSELSEVNFERIDEPEAMNYEDYLRILLMLKGTCDNELKIKRIADLIQLNMQIKIGNGDFKLENKYTRLNIESSFYIKYMFISKAIIPSKFKNIDRERHKIIRKLSRGYS